MKWFDELPDKVQDAFVVCLILISISIPTVILCHVSSQYYEKTGCSPGFYLKGPNYKKPVNRRNVRMSPSRIPNYVCVADDNY